MDGQGEHALQRREGGKANQSEGAVPAGENGSPVPARIFAQSGREITRAGKSRGALRDRGDQRPSRWIVLDRQGGRSDQSLYGKVGESGTFYGKRVLTPFLSRCRGQSGA